MMIPVNTQLGELQIVQVLIEYDGPQMFVCANERGTRWLAVHAPRSEGRDNWLYSEISDRRLNDILDGRVSLHDAFALPEGGVTQIVSFDSNDTVSVAHVQASEVPIGWIPDRGEYLEPEERSAWSGLANLPSFLRIPEIIRRQTPMWEVAPETLAYLKSIRTPVEVAATHSGRFVIDFILGRGAMTTRTDLPLATLGKLLTVAQGLVDVLGQAVQGTVKDTGPVSNNVRRRTQFNAVSLFPSSFGFRAESEQGSLVPENGTQGALSILVDLMSIGSNEPLLEEKLRSLGRRPLVHYKAFTKALVRSERSFSLDIGIPHAATPLKIDLSHQQIIAIAEILERESARTAEVIDVEGQLVAVSLPTKYFRIENSDRVVSGRIDDSCLAALDGKPINKLHKAKVRVITDVNDASGEETVKYFLLELEEIQT